VLFKGVTGKLVIKSEMEKQLVRNCRPLKESIKVDLAQIIFDDVDWTEQARVRILW
jgi:hypothetical protein